MSTMPPDTGDLLADLAALVPGAAVQGHPQTEVAGAAPAARVTPVTVLEVQQIVRWAAERGLALAATGGGTKLGAGNPPERLDLLLDMSALESIVEYDADDLILIAQAGASIGRLQAAAARDSLVLPLDPRSPARATLGGVIACADHGPHRRQYGGLRDVVLGLKAVLPDGTLVTFGGRTLKNVAGYDVGKLFIGSLGTIGVIVEATVRLLPPPGREELLLVPLGTLEQARRLVAKILDSVIIPSTVELISPANMPLLGFNRDRPAAGAESDRAATGSDSDRAGSVGDSPGGETAAPHLLLITLEGHPAAVERQVGDVLAMGAVVGAAPASGLSSDSASGAGAAAGPRRASEIGLTPTRVWEAFSGLREKAREGGFSVGLRGTVPLSRIWDIAAAMEQRAGASGVTVAYTMSCGTGTFEVHAGGPPAGLRSFAQEARVEAEGREGALTVLEGWPELGQDFDAWGSLRSDYRLIEAVKQKYDPKRIMNPGRFVGGL